MRLLLFFFLICFDSWPKSTVLIGHFDSFGKAPFNASEKVAAGLLTAFKDHEQIDLKTCRLSTVFDKSYLELEACYKDLKEPPILVLGLGEFGCDLKVEAWGRNFDKTDGPDNEGNERAGTKIIPEAQAMIGLTYPLPEMYCVLNQDERRSIQVSNNAGSFVCNNLAFQFTHHYADVSFGFIHVPSHHCWFLERRMKKSIEILGKMIEGSLINRTPVRLPVEKSELEDLLQKSPEKSCLREFYQRLPGADERAPRPFSAPK